MTNRELFDRFTKAAEKSANKGVRSMGLGFQMGVLFVKTMDAADDDHLFDEFVNDFSELVRIFLETKAEAQLA